MNPHENKKVCILFGTRPEIIKLAPVIKAVDAADGLSAVPVSSSQHTDLLRPMLELFEVEVAHDLAIMQPGQTLNGIASRVIAGLETLFARENFSAVVVQGDTTTAMAGAIAAFNQRIPVVHVEAGLRSGNVNSPFPEEMNRQVIGRIASLHCAATESNAAALIAEGIDRARVHVTGNPVIDALESLDSDNPETGRPHRIVLTTHRRESFGEAMNANLQVLRKFVEADESRELIFPVHPNPAVRAAAEAAFGTHPRIQLIAPQPYPEFIRLLRSAWLIVSDSGGIQEEAPSLGKPVLVLRANTERTEAVDAGWSRLTGNDPAVLQQMLSETNDAGEWPGITRQPDNPFGDGQAATRIAASISSLLNDGDNI
jgi:UDP-N-acetylglucosamine 2-epimerase (non-hydrolysing)